ncbi:MAG TPA: amino acid adenylation domain-containing protein [Ktedonobacteraceae bacterium]
MVGRYQIPLEEVVDGVELYHQTLLSLDEKEQPQLEWNATSITYPDNRPLAQLFEQQVELTPEAIALIFEGQTLTYRELNERSNQLAHYLRTFGIGPEVRVALCIERSLEMIIALLGILKTGGAYVPLDPTYPEERLAFMLDDAQAAVLITRQKLLHRLPSHGQIICLDTVWQRIVLESKENSSVASAVDHIAYVMYTSGSTGQPKGVSGTHKAALNRFHWMWTTYPFAPEEVCCQKTSLSFVDSVWEIFGPLLKGLCTVILPDMVVKDTRLLLHALETYAITRIVLVPSLLQALLDTSDDFSGSVFHLRYCISSGEALPLDLALRFIKSMPQCTLLNLYGSSEVAADATYYNVTQALVSHGRVLIGRPLANTQIYLLNAAMQAVPLGDIGELYVGGDGLARGYFNRPELTAALFVPNPLSREPGARLYKTGDLARYLPDGNIEYVGRVDHQIKIRGVRIDPGEIEHLLCQHPAVRAAVVVVREVTSGDKRLVAYVVFHQGHTATSRDLQEHIVKVLPPTMLPSLFVGLDALPLTPNGKVDRRALPAPEQVHQPAEEFQDVPTSLVHQRLQQIWEALLEVRPIGIKDNFFYLGGHSLLAARLVTQIDLAFGKELSLATLFAGPTIEQLALALLKEERGSRVSLVAIQSDGYKRPFFYLHGAWNSDAFYCFHLAQHLGPEQPFYALAPYDFSELRVVPSIEEMASAHIQSLRAVQPEGPYRLGGFCNGGLVAYEMARQLQAAGQGIEKLVLIEPAYSPVLHILARRVMIALGRLFHLSQKKQVVAFLRLRHLYKYLLHQVTMENIKTSRAIDPSLLTWNPTADALLLDDNALLDWIIAGYKYHPYFDKISLIWAHEEPFRGIWRWKVARESGIKLHVIPGTHIGCRTDHVHALAEMLRRCMSDRVSDEGSWKS